MARPREVSLAQGLLWLALAMSSVNFVVALANHFDLLPALADDSQDETIASQFLGALGIGVQAFCIVWVGRGHGLIRWPLLLGIGWIISKVAIDRPLWDGQLLAPIHRIEPLGAAIRTGASILLFLPRSNTWFRERQRARTVSEIESTGETQPWNLRARGE